MQHRLAIVNNIKNLQDAWDHVSGRGTDLPGMMLVHGNTGYGKTTAITWLANRIDAMFVRAAATWTPSTMLSMVVRELGADPKGKNAELVSFIVEEMASFGRPLIVDEADYLLGNLKMLETLRDIHDMSGIPVILVGMEGIERKIVHRKQLARRISQWIKFQPLDLADARLVAETVSEVRLANDLLAELHAAANGSVGLITVGLAQVERLGKANRLAEIDAQMWAGRPFFLGNRPNGGAL